MAVRSSQVKLYTGNANPELAQQIAHILGIPLGQAKVGKFQNGETMVEIEVRDLQLHPSFVFSRFYSSVDTFCESDHPFHIITSFTTLFHSFHNPYALSSLHTATSCFPISFQTHVGPSIIFVILTIIAFSDIGFLQRLRCFHSSTHLQPERQRQLDGASCYGGCYASCLRETRHRSRSSLWIC